MRTTAFVAAAAAVYASATSAYPYISARHINATEQWGSWIVTSPSSSYPPSGSQRSLDFLVRYESQADAVHCGAYFPGSAQGVGPSQSYTVCNDEAVSFTSDLSIGNIWIMQRLYQRGVIVTLKGSAPLYLYGGNCTANAVGGGACSGPPFRIPVTSYNIQLANGTVIGNETTSAGDAIQEGDAVDGNNQGDSESSNSRTDSSYTGGNSDSDSITSNGGTAGQQESNVAGGTSSDRGSSHDDGATYRNSTVIDDGHGPKNNTWRGGHRNGTHYRRHYA